MITWLATLRALAAPRRAIPLGVVALATFFGEWWASRSLNAVLVDLGLFAAFCGVAPATWRILCSRPKASRLSVAIGYLAWSAIGASVVALFALGIPLATATRWTYVLEPASLGMVLVLFLVGGWGLGRDIELEAGVEAERRRADQLALEAERAQLLALRNQLDPHFLFNTLNAIAEWCREDPKVVEAATLELAAILRAILDGIRQPTWPLARELELMTSLFELYRIRDSERYALEVELPDPLPVASVPPMILLPLFENAITHGPAAGHSGEVRLVVEEVTGGVVVRIENPGAFRGRRLGGEGIAIAERRLRLAYGEVASLNIAEQRGATLTVVSLPPQPSVLEQLA